MVDLVTGKLVSGIGNCTAFDFSQMFALTLLLIDFQVADGFFLANL